MKAAIVVKPGVLVVKDIPPPAITGEYDVLCRILYGATCSGTDEHLIHGRIPWPVSYPVLLGHESVGVVEAVGVKVRHIKKGDILTSVGVPSREGYFSFGGGFAEYGLARDHWAMKEDGLAQKLWQPYLINQVVPGDIPPDQATMIVTWRETLSYITRMKVASGSRILIIGSGGNGLAFAAHAKGIGAKEIVMIGSGGRGDIAARAGVTGYFDYRREPYKGVAASYPSGFDFIIDAIGKRGQINAALAVAAENATVGIYGIDDRNENSIAVSAVRKTFTFYAGGYVASEVHGEVVRRMRDGSLDASLWIDVSRPYPLERIGEAFAAVERRECVKALVACNQ